MFEKETWLSLRLEIELGTVNCYTSPCMDYELTIVLSEKATPAKKKAVTEMIEKMVKLFKGKVTGADDWGKIVLTYPIEKNNSGVFLHFRLELENQAPGQINQKMRLEKDIIRYLLVRKN